MGSAKAGPAALLRPLRSFLTDRKPRCAPASASGAGRRWSGWHYTIIGGISVTAFSLLCNIILLIIGLSKVDSGTGRGQLSAGSCETTPTIDTTLHIGINVLSALLLGASNAAMQCLSAPTRADLDRLHAAGQSADIGLSGVRNFKIMSRLRRTLWMLLLISSIPLHLMYNSVVVSTMTGYSWYGYLVTTDFLQLPGQTASSDWNHTVTGAFKINPLKLTALQQNASSGTLERMETSRCIQVFNTQYTYNYASVLLVAEDIPYAIPPNSGTVLGVYEAWASEDMGNFENLTYVVEARLNNPAQAPEPSISDPSQDDRFTIGAGTSFSPAAWPMLWNHTPAAALPDFTPDTKFTPPPDFSFVSYCLAEPAQQLCTVDTIPAIQGVVVVLNVVKLVCLLTLLLRVPDQPLITLGDAITSFLTYPDETTKRDGPVDLIRMKRRRDPNTPMPRWEPSGKRRWWFRGVSPMRWAITFAICVGYWLLGAVYSGLGFYRDLNLSKAFSRYDPTTTGNQLTVLPGGDSINATTDTTISTIMFANVFQLILSIAYFQYNGVVTSMLLSREFTNFARYRKGLRVSTPKGAQRRTFWLSLPYSYNMPLLALAGILHWLLSESLFYQELSLLDGGMPMTFGPTGLTSLDAVKRPMSGMYINTDALSILSIFALCCILLVIFLGFRRFAGGIPIVRSNSLALSAACHGRPSGQLENPLEPIQWGIRSRNAEGVADVGFSSDHVEVVDPSSLKFSVVERLIYRWKGGFHSRVAARFRRRTRGSVVSGRAQTMVSECPDPKDVLRSKESLGSGFLSPGPLERAGESATTLVEVDLGHDSARDYGGENRHGWTMLPKCEEAGSIQWDHESND